MAAEKIRRENEKKFPSVGKLLFHGGNHAVEAVFELAQIVDCHAVAVGDFCGGVSFNRVFAVGGHSAIIKHSARENVFDGGPMAGKTETHIHYCRRVRCIARQVVHVNGWSLRTRIAVAKNSGPSKTTPCHFATVAVNEKTSHH